ALPFALSYIGSPIFLPKYTIPASIPWTILAATGIWSLRGHVARAGVLVVCLGLGLYQLPEYYRVATKDGWREAAATIETTAQTGDVVILYPPFNTIAFNFYHERP